MFMYIAVLIVYIDPVVTFTRPPENTTVCRGSKVIISCGYQSVTPLPVTWIINGTSFTEDDIRNKGYRLDNPTTPNALTLTIWSINDNITLQCVVHSTVSTTSAPGTVTVAAGMYVQVQMCITMYIHFVRQT